MNKYRIEYRGNDDQVFSFYRVTYSRQDAIEQFDDWCNRSDFHQNVSIVSVTKL